LAHESYSTAILAPARAGRGGRARTGTARGRVAPCPHAGFEPLAGDHHDGADDGGHAGGVADGLRLHFAGNIPGVADVIDIGAALFCHFLPPSTEAADVRLALGARAERKPGRGSNVFKNWNGDDGMALVIDGRDAEHPDVLQRRACG